LNTNKCGVHLLLLLLLQRAPIGLTGSFRGSVVSLNTNKSIRLFLLLLLLLLWYTVTWRDLKI
jgi:hypothetical protein